MSERWEKVIEYELDLLYKAPEYEADLKDRLLENEMDIQYPVTRFDEIEGRVYLSCPGTEEQAIKRIEKREAIEALIEKLYRRTGRMWRAIDQLTETERELIILVYIDRDIPELHMSRTLGFKTVKEFKNAKKIALLKLLELFNTERKEHAMEVEKKLIEKKKDIIREYLGIAK